MKVLWCAGVWAIASFAQMPVWQDNVTLWRHTYHLNQGSAQAAVNYGVAYRRAGDRAQAVEWLVTAWALAGHGPRATEIRAVARMELLALETLGYPACSHPRAQPACS